jgi:hypothetical protein
MTKPFDADIRIEFNEAFRGKVFVFLPLLYRNCRLRNRCENSPLRIG